MASELAQAVKKRKDAWAWYNRSCRNLLSATNKLQNYTSKVNSRGGYIAEKQLNVSGDLLVEVLTYVNVVKGAFSDMGIVLTGTPYRVDAK
jgi:hypothetical protein